MLGLPTKWVTGVGRSGTTWLAVVLARATEESYFYHEPCISVDKWGMIDALEKPDGVIDWWAKTRVPVVVDRMDRDQNWVNSLWYGEANSLIRYQIPAIRHWYPDAPVLHLFRDGREVVRSLHPRAIYAPHGGVNNMFAPRPGEKWHGQWKRFDRFQKLCWFWQHGVMHVDPLADGRIEFRTMLEDFDYFTEAVSEPLGIPVSRDHWEDYRRPERKKNHTGKHTLGPYCAWTREMKIRFWDICGDAMDLLDYTTPAVYDEED